MNFSPLMAVFVLENSSETFGAWLTSGWAVMEEANALSVVPKIFFEEYNVTAHSCQTNGQLHAITQSKINRVGVGISGAALTQISAFLLHKNLDANKIMEAMCTQKQGLSLNISQTTCGKWSRMVCKYHEEKVCIICEEHLIPLSCFTNPIGTSTFEVYHSFLY